MRRRSGEQLREGAISLAYDRNGQDADELQGARLATQPDFIGQGILCGGSYDFDHQTISWSISASHRIVSMAQTANCRA